MKRPQSIRLLTVGVVTTLVAGVLALIGVGLGPATANHESDFGDLVLEVYREITAVNVTGVDPGETPVEFKVTARVQTQAGTPPPPGVGAGVPIDFEFEGGKLDSEGGANTPETPDRTCTTGDSGIYPTCTLTFNVNLTHVGTTMIRAWIDHDSYDEEPVDPFEPRGGTEADFGEGRLAGLDTGGGSVPTDCATELPGVGPVPGGNGSVAGDDPVNDCLSEDDGEATAGDTEEYDQTDVVKVIIFRDNVAVNTINCPELTQGPTGSAITVTCVVTDDEGSPRKGVWVDGEHILGANDPGSGDNDYASAAASDSQGRVSIEVAGGPTPGYATICFWIDTDHGVDGTPPIPGLEDPGFDIDGGPEDGGNCDSINQARNTDVAKQFTDRVEVRWAAATPSTLDVAPDTARLQINNSHTMTATVFDQFGAAWTASPQKVNFEFMGGSVNDADNSSTGSPDASCTTKGDGSEGSNTCTVGYTSTKAGTDTICTWLDGVKSGDDNTVIRDDCGGEGQANNQGGNSIDVVRVDWSNPPPPPTAPGEASRGQGYVFVGSDGGIFNYGLAEFHGSTGNLKLNQPVIGIAYMPGGDGYWLVAKDGGVFSFGAAKFYGSMGDKALNAPVLGMESTPTGKGYWLFAADGGIFSFGDASFKGSTGNMKLNQPVVGMAVKEKGDGYWLVAQDGGVFSFNAPFHGSTGNMKLNEPVFDMAPAAGDKGYWLVARDGGVFTFGPIAFHGSATNVPGRSTVVGMGDTPTGNGYWIGDVNGKAMPFGDAKFLGDASTLKKNAPMVAFASVQPKNT